MPATVYASNCICQQLYMPATVYASNCICQQLYMPATVYASNCICQIYRNCICQHHLKIWNYLGKLLHWADTLKFSKYSNINYFQLVNKSIIKYFGIINLCIEVICYAEINNKNIFFLIFIFLTQYSVTKDKTTRCKFALNKSNNNPKHNCFFLSESWNFIFATLLSSLVSQQQVNAKIKRTRTLEQISLHYFLFETFFYVGPRTKGEV